MHRRLLSGTCLCSSLLAGCGPRRPPIPPVPAPLIGSCYQLDYEPHPPPVGNWKPADTVRFLSVPFARSVDSAGETDGRLQRAPSPPDQPRQADWWVAGRQIRLAYRTLRGDRILEFDSLTPPGRGRWRQTGGGSPLTGAVTAALLTCHSDNRR